MDIEEYLTDIGIAYKSSGKNISKKSIGICCPKCGDTNYHFGIKKEDLQFNCWRCHIKGNFISLISLLENISLPKAFLRFKELSEKTNTYEEETIMDMVDNILKESVIKQERKESIEIKLPEGLELILDNPIKKYYEYLLERRKFNFEDFVFWDCYYCSEGEYEDYLIFPIFMNNFLVTFLARSVMSNKLRYNNLDEESSILTTKESLYLYDEYDCKSDLFLVEGIFEALRFKSFGYSSMAIFSNSLSDVQFEFLLSKLPEKPYKIYIALDRGEYYNSIKIKNKISDHINNKILIMDIKNYKDYGECNDKNYIDKLKGECDGR